MIWFIIFGILALVGFAVFVCLNKEDIKNTQDSIWGLMLLLLFMLIVGTMCAILCAGVSTGMVACAAKTDLVLIEIVEITALNDNATASGRFLLGSGQVEDKIKYYYAQKTEKGAVVDSVSADNAYIIESNTETPRIEKWEYRWSNRSLVWLTLTDGPGVYEIKIYIPENSVTTNFSVDLDNGSLTTRDASTTLPSNATNYCSNCNHTLSENDNFCSSCGTSSREAVSMCPNCKTEQNTAFCPDCQLLGY